MSDDTSPTRKFWCCAFASRPEGATTFQPRASPWGPDRNEKSHALKGHDKRVGQSIVSPFQGWAESHSHRIPRALPWAFLFGPFGASEANIKTRTRASMDRAQLIGKPL